MLLGRVPGIATEHTGRRQLGVAAYLQRPALRPSVQTSNPRPHGLMKPSEMPPQPGPQPGGPMPLRPTRALLPDTPPHDGIEPREEKKHCIDCVHRVLRGMHTSMWAIGQTVPRLCLRQCARMSTVFDQQKSFNTNAWSIVHRSIILPLPRMIASRSAG